MAPNMFISKKEKDPFTMSAIKRGSEDSDRLSSLFTTTDRGNSPYTTTHGEGDMGETGETWVSTDRFASARQQLRERRLAGPKSPRYFLVLVACVMIVLHLSHLLTKGTEMTERFLVNMIKMTHVVCVVVALVAMVMFVCESSARRISERTPTPTNNLRIALIGLHAGFSIAGLTIKIEHMLYNGPEIDVICLLLYVTLGVFCIVQTLFLWRYRRWRCLNWKLKVPMAFLVSINLSLCVGASFSFADTSNYDLIDDASKSENNTIINATVDAEDSGTDTCDEVELSRKLVAESLYCSFLFGFYVLSIIALWELWSLNARLGSRSPSPYSRLADSEESLSPHCSNKVLALICKIYFLIIKTICRYVLQWSISLCLGLFVFYLYVNFAHTNLLFIDQTCLICNDSVASYDELEEVYAWCRTAFYYTMCTIAFIGFLLTFRLESIAGSYSPSMFVLILSGLSQLVIVLFQIVDLTTGLAVLGRDTFKADTPELYILKAVFHIINLFSQTYIILKYSGDVQPLTAQSNRNLYVRSVIKFLIVVNVDRWVRTLMFSPTVTEYLDAIGNPSDTFKREVWCQFSEIVTPVSAFYRLQSALMCYDIYKSSTTT